MTEKLYYWADNLQIYSSDNEKDYNQIIEIKRLNFFIGKIMLVKVGFYGISLLPMHPLKT